MHVEPQQVPELQFWPPQVQNPWVQVIPRSVQSFRHVPQFLSSLNTFTHWLVVAPNAVGHPMYPAAQQTFAAVQFVPGGQPESLSH